MIADSSQTRILGRFMVSSCVLFCGFRVCSLTRRPFCTLNRRRFGLRMIGMPLTLSAPVSILCSFMPLCLELTSNFSHWRVPAILVWSLLLADSHLCKLSLQLVFVTLSWSTMIALSSWSWPKNTASSMHMSSIFETRPALNSSTWSKMDSMLGRLAYLRTSSFDT